MYVEDYFFDYGIFEGCILKGEYGVGEVVIWDCGCYEFEKWCDEFGYGEVILIIYGEKYGL